jgi:transposase
MRLVGCDLHATQQSIAMLDRDTGEIVEKTLSHEGGAVREFYASIPRPVMVGIEATGSMGWFLRLMEELEIPCRVGHPAAVRKAETRRQKHDRRDADDGPQDSERVRAIQYRERGRPSRGCHASRRRDRDNFRDN